MSTAFPDHGSLDQSLVVSSPGQHHTLRTETSAQGGHHMEQAAQSRPARQAVASDIDSAAYANHPVDTTSSAPLKQNGRTGSKELNKRSLDYVLRSGLAGGLAGCAVSLGFLYSRGLVLRSWIVKTFGLGTG
jgi:solute carrier family 25 protein 16